MPEPFRFIESLTASEIGADERYPISLGKKSDFPLEEVFGYWICDDPSKPPAFVPGPAVPLYRLAYRARHERRSRFR